MIGMVLAGAIGALSASSAPHTTGDIRINLATGRIVGAVCVENWPAAAAGSATLNTGLTIARVKDGAGKPLSFNSWQGGTLDREARAFTFEAPATGPVCFDYFGAAPMFPDHDAKADFKGMIAADGKSLRVSEQTVWLPAPFDPQAKKRLQDTTYRLHVICDDCTLLYMGGAAPARGGDTILESGRPVAPLLFAGTGPVDIGPDVTFVNAQLTPEARAGWTQFYHRVRGFYADYLARPFGGMPTILRFDSLDKGHNPKRQWGFASWPTIALGNGDLEAMGRSLPRDDEDAWGQTAYLAHETAHYYFGGDGIYRWFLVESTAEFMSWKALAAIKGRAAMNARIASRVAAMSWDVLPFNTLERPERIGENYRYVYGPLLLESLDRTIGDARMRRFMRALLAAPPKTWDDFGQIARGAGVSEAEWTAWTKRCIDGAPKACINDLAPTAPAKP